jgi:CheY-like chemotaxis protein
MAVPAPALQPSSRPANILVVDDDPMVRKVCALFLSEHKYEVTTAGDGLEALQLIDRALPDLIISDLRMPRMSGFEFLSIVRRRFPQMPLIAISGEFLAAGDPALGIADVFYAKGSCSPAKLVEHVADLLAHPPVRHGLENPPMWVPVNASGEVIITCTSCLRSFAVRACPPAFGNPPRQVECVCCSTILHYYVDALSLPVGQRSWETCGALTQLRKQDKSA